MGSENWSTWQPWDKSLRGTLAAAQTDELETMGYETTEEAVEANGSDGTSSVLDISGFSTEPEPAQCWELTPDECEENLGTRRPTREQIEKKIDELVEGLSRGESLCVIAWKKDKPEEVYFSGWSFD